MKTVDEYLKHLTVSQRAEFERVRKLVKSMVPDAGEKISYGVPTFTYKGTYLLYFGAFKNHMSLYPAQDALVEAVPELEKFRVSKGTLRFTHENPIPDNLIKHMLQFRRDQIDANARS